MKSVMSFPERGNYGDSKWIRSNKCAALKII